MAAWTDTRWRRNKGNPQAHVNKFQQVVNSTAKKALSDQAIAGGVITYTLNADAVKNFFYTSIAEEVGSHLIATELQGQVEGQPEVRVMADAASVEQMLRGFVREFQPKNVSTAAVTEAKQVRHRPDKGRAVRDAVDELEIAFGKAAAQFSDERKQEILVEHVLSDSLHENLRAEGHKSVKRETKNNLQLSSFEEAADFAEKVENRLVEEAWSLKLKGEY